MDRAQDARRICALGFAAFTFPAVVVLPRLGWLWATVSAALAAVWIALLICLAHRDPKGAMERARETRWGRSAALLMFFWNMVALGRVANQLCGVYPTADGSPLIGLLLLLMAACAAQKGTEVVLRMGAVLFFVVAGFYLLLLGFSLPDLRENWLEPTMKSDWSLLAAAFVPVPAILLRRGGEREGKLALWLLGGVVLTFLVALVCAGSLSPSVAAAERFPFYTAAKSVSLLHIMERLEALVSAVASVSGFCLLAMLCTVNGRLLESFFPHPEKLTSVSNFLLGGACMWLSGRMPTWLGAMGIGIFWVFVPILIQGMGILKKTEKVEKSS